MAVSVATSGSQTTTVDTWVSVATQTAPSSGAIYQLRVDLNALLAGEALDVELSTKTRAADATRVLYRLCVGVAPLDELVRDLPAVAAQTGNELVIQFKQRGGSARAIPWVLLRLDG